MKPKKKLLIAIATVVLMVAGAVAYFFGAAEKEDRVARRYAIARKCAELDPNVANWIYDAAMGSAKYAGQSEEYGDDCEGGLTSYSAECAMVAVYKTDGSVMTNEYQLFGAEHYENGTISNFQSRAIKLVAELVDGMVEQCPFVLGTKNGEVVK